MDPTHAPPGNETGNQTLQTLPPYQRGAIFDRHGCQESIRQTWRGAAAFSAPSTGNSCRLCRCQPRNRQILPPKARSDPDQPGKNCRPAEVADPSSSPDDDQAEREPATGTMLIRRSFTTTHRCNSRRRNPLIYAQEAIKARSDKLFIRFPQTAYTAAVTPPQPDLHRRPDHMKPQHGCLDAPDIHLCAPRRSIQGEGGRAGVGEFLLL